jgi:hypothetical protein
MLIMAAAGLLKDATVKRFYYETHDQLRRHPDEFVAAYNFARRLKTLKGFTPYVHLQILDKEPQRFKLDPIHPAPEPNSYSLQVRITRKCRVA